MTLTSQPVGAMQTYARVAGAAYLAIFVLAIFANFSVLQSILVPGDAQGTLNNLLASEDMFRIAIAAMFVVMAADVVVGWALHVIFRTRRAQLSLLMLMFRLVYTISHIGVLLLLVGALRLATIQAPDLDASLQAVIVSELVRGHGAGFTLTLIFFGIHLVLLAVLIWQTQLLPRWLGLLVALAGTGYLLDGFGWLLIPNIRAANPAIIVWVVILPALVGEGVLTLWLLVRGVRSGHQDIIEKR